jgi:hypothetical protein
LGTPLPRYFGVGGSTTLAIDTYEMLYLLAQSVADSVGVTEAVETATGLRPSEFLMAFLCIVALTVFLRHLGQRAKSDAKRETDNSTALAAAISKHSDVLNEVSSKFAVTIERINDKNHEENRQGRESCHAQTAKMIESTALVQMCVQDVKEMAQGMIENHIKQKELVDSQGKLVHEQRGTVHELKLLIEAALVQIAGKSGDNLHLHEHRIVENPTVIDETKKS